MRGGIVGGCLILVVTLMPPAVEGQDQRASVGDPYQPQRERLLQEIESDVRATRHWIGRGELALGVMAALRKVPRHQFVPPGQRPHAYENRPLPIGYGQTISQPYIVALMTELLDPEPGDVVFELGTGSGYQAAVLSELVREVYTVEIVPELGHSAAQRLQDLGYNNVTVRVGDGYYGWKEHGPFDGILVTAAANHVPLPLIAQLKPGGVMVIPVGGPFTTQQLMIVTKDSQGKIQTRQVLPVRFVPVMGQH